MQTVGCRQGQLVSEMGRARDGKFAIGRMTGVASSKSVEAQSALEDERGLERAKGKRGRGDGGKKGGARDGKANSEVERRTEWRGKS